jgi:hypothetical protein
MKVLECTTVETFVWDNHCSDRVIESQLRGKNSHSMDTNDFSVARAGVSPQSFKDSQRRILTYHGFATSPHGTEFWCSLAGLSRYAALAPEGMPCGTIKTEEIKGIK